MVVDAQQVAAQAASYGTDDALSLIADKWTLQIFKALREGNTHFGQLLRAIPDITRKMLAQTLRKMERDGLIERRDFGEVPPRVEYAITPTGQSLLERLCALCQWANEFFPQVEAARQRFDASD
jgi:DNA-binding HxlR family transcriptional regulator